MKTSVNKRPSDVLFNEFWREKYKEFREKFVEFNKRYSVPVGRWETAIAIMPNNETAQRYKYLSGIAIPSGSRFLEGIGRNFGGFTFIDYCKNNNFDLKPVFAEEDIASYYAELCEKEFPETSFSDPTEFDYDKELGFNEYKATHGGEYAYATIIEHIVFPYDFVTSYPIPLFQPQASLYFLTRIRKASRYQASIMPDSLTTEENVLLNGTYGAQGINSFLNQFLTSAKFREWERTINAELSILRYMAFFKDLGSFLTIENGNWDNALQQSLSTLVRGNISICENIEKISEGTLSPTDRILIDLKKEIGQIFCVDTTTGWNKISKSRTSLLDRYSKLVPEVIGLMRAISGKEAEARAEAREKEVLKKQARMMELLEKPFHILTEALNETRENTQELHAILFAPQQGIFAAQRNIAELFINGNIINNPDTTVTKIYHQPEDYCKKNIINDAKWVLAHALARFSGRELKGYTDADHAIDGEAEFLKRAAVDDNNSLHDYSKAFFHLLGFENREAIGDDFKARPVQYLDCLKSRLFTPFKPDKAEDPIKWPILYALIPKLHLVSADLNGNRININHLNATAIIASKANPLVTQGHLLDFICGVVEANETDQFNATLKLTGSSRDDPDSVELIITAGVAWIENDKKGKFLKKLKDFLAIRCMDGRLQGEYGNFHRPFAVLMERCSRDVLPNVNDGISLIWPYLEVKFDKNIFCIFSKRGGE